jgi:hypothetical protein
MTETPAPTVTAVRYALITESTDFHSRRQPYSKTMLDRDASRAVLDAYEGLVAAGSYGWALAAILRLLNEKYGADCAAEVASIVHEVMENGTDGLDEANEDVWAAIEAEDLAEAQAVQGRPDAGGGAQA